MLWIRPIRARKSTAPNPVMMPTTTARIDNRNSPSRIGRRSFILHQRTSGRSELADGAEVPGAAARILADSDRRIADESVGRYRQIVGRRHPRKYAAGRIVFRPVARAEIATGPVGDRSGEARLRVEQRDAAKVCADTDQDAQFRLDRARGVGGVGRLLLMLGVRI